MKYIEYIDLVSAVASRIETGEFEPGEIGRAAEMIMALASSGQAEARRNTGHVLKGQMHRSKAALALYDGDALIAHIAVCLRSKHSDALWTKLNQYSGLDPAWLSPSVPWVAVSYVDELMLPPWFDRVVQGLGASMIVHSTGPAIF